ncbi:hypothetical protein, variant 1 [Aphanomyces invadans]|uniref:Centrosomal protein of 70 kDa n=2 Tax=Aphanomyces invadans TaxID=157072 RepID=A0A024TKY5_9STRA|nr:hypothetical protein, variant 1 [Aphanomyces invadans]ETV93987.1 hypothetical protein, variant 1 [Aphanomyces invadans]|eukprot:XP_008877189.1 hypothetical protein, variant 1 [Aphanomyces invadans]
MNSTSLSDLEDAPGSSSSVDRFLLEHGIRLSSNSVGDDKDSSFSIPQTTEHDAPLTLDDFSPALPSHLNSFSTHDDETSQIHQDAAYLRSLPREPVQSSPRAPSNATPHGHAREESSMGMAGSTTSTPSGRRHESSRTNSHMSEPRFGQSSVAPPSMDQDTPDNEWRPLNTLLAQHGFSPIELIPTSTGVIPKMDALFAVVHDLIVQLERRGQIIQDLVLDSDLHAKKHAKAETHLASHEMKITDVTEALERSQGEVQSLKTELMRATAKLESEQKAFKLQKSKLEQQLKISEHRVKAKEGLLERLQHKFQQVMDKEDVSKTRTREVFRTIQQRDPRKSSAADLKSLELIAMYETEREKMTAEIAQLRSQVQELCCDVRDKENVLLRQTGANGFTQRDAFVEKLEQARLEQEQSSRQLRHKEAIIQEKVNKIEIELRHSKDIIADLRDENANLILEVQSRPTIRDYKAIQRRVVLLERQLSDQKAAVQDAHTLEDLRKYMGTAELIHRDKVNAKLHLNRLTTLPKEACLDVIQDICRQLDLTDVTLIGPSVAKLISVVQAVPRMEKFIHGVCGCISQNGIVPLEIVTSTLTKWKNDLTHLAQLQSFTDKLHAILSRRSHDNVQDIQGPISHNRALHVVEELVAFETHFSHEREMYSLAITNVDQPDVLIHKMIQHFRHLFGVKSMEGVFPKINEVFLFVNEMNNALASIKESLGLARTVSVAHALNELRTALQKMTDPKRPPLAPDTHESYVVTGKSDVVGVAAVRQQHVTLTKLKQVLGAQTIDELVPRATRLMELLSVSGQ